MDSLIAHDAYRCFASLNYGHSSFGAATSGSVWRFLRLAGSSVALDEQEYRVRQLPELLGVLTQVVGAGELAAAG